MYDRFTARSGRRRRPRLGGRRRNGRYRTIGWIVALGATVPVILLGFHLAHSGAARHLTTSADAQGDMSGWGRGGFPMMPGPAGAPVLGPVNAADAMSANWAGYAAAGQPGAFTSVSSSWSESAVTCDAGQTFSAFWVGLDGDGTPTVEQTGTEADCANGAATYQGWYEIFPNPPVFYNNPVRPADAMSASVVSNGNGMFTLTLSDATQGWTQTTQQSEPNAQLGSAEIIAEAPSNGQQVLPLANFGTVNFSSATVDNQPLGNQGQNLTAITMAAAATTLATPSALAGGTAFSVTWDSSGAAATPAGAQAPVPASSASSASPASSATSPADWIWGYPGDSGFGDGGQGSQGGGGWWNSGF